jgi:2-dehydropantoate 2-reductase
MVKSGPERPGRSPRRDPKARPIEETVAMRIVVLGAGAIGTLYAAKLAAENAVTLVVRKQEQADVICSRGVEITGLERASVRIEAAAGLDRIDPDTLIVLTTKVYDNAAAVAPIVDLLRSDTVIVCLQNGLNGERVVRDVVGNRCVVLRGITEFGAIFLGPGKVSLRAYGPTTIEAGPGSRELAEMFTRCQLRGRVSVDITRDVWRKLIVNCVINPLTAITGMEVGWTADERLDPLKRRIVAECLAVAAHDGVAFDGDFTRMINETYGPSRNLSSMYQDLANGKRTEIDQMNGAVVELGRQYGVECPVNAGLVAIIKAMEGQDHGVPLTNQPSQV